MSLRLLEIAGANASCAELDSFNCTAVVDFDGLKVDFKGTFGILHDVHTDTAGLLGQTLAGDAAAVGFGLAANSANSAHFILAVLVI